MTPQIEKQISELLELVKNGAEQLPPYLQTLAQQAVISELISSILGIVIAMVSLTSAALLAKRSLKLFKAARDKNDKNYAITGSEDFFPYAIFAAGISLLGLIPLFLSGQTLFRCLYCPDLVAFEALRGLLH